MPKRQRSGSVVKLPSGKWGVRFYDENGKRQRSGGATFATSTAAGEWLDNRIKEVAALRRGDLVTPSELLTVSELVDRFLELHDVDPATIKKLRTQLKHATKKFGEKGRTNSVGSTSRRGGSHSRPVSVTTSSARSGNCSRGRSHETSQHAIRRRESRTRNGSVTSGGRCVRSSSGTT